MWSVFPLPLTPPIAQPTSLCSDEPFQWSRCCSCVIYSLGPPLFWRVRRPEATASFWESPLFPLDGHGEHGWLHLSLANQSGTGSANVIFRFDANPGATRTGTLTIGGQTLAVTQAGSTYVAANPLTALVSSGLYFPTGVAVDGAGNVYFAESGNNTINGWYY